MAIGVAGREIVGSTDAGGVGIGIDTDSVETEAVGGGAGPGAGDNFGAGGADITGGVGEGNAGLLGQRTILVGQNFVAGAVGRRNGKGISSSRADIGNKGTESDLIGTNGEGKVFKGVVDILKTGFEGVGGGSVLAGGQLADSVGKLVVGRSFLAGGDVEITPIDTITRRSEGLSDNFFGKTNYRNYQ